jgi:glycosyltransferase involved in cell wall biosynthesis
VNIIFIHQNAPGQWRHIAADLAADPANRVVVIGKVKRHEVPGAEFRLYDGSALPERPDDNSAEEQFKLFLAHGRGCAGVLEQLKNEGFQPDVIAVHPGWGEGTYVKDVFPDVPLLDYCEFYYRSRGGDYGFANATSLAGDMGVRSRNAGLLLSFESMDWGICPTNWQKRQHPAVYHDRITVIHEGIDTDTVRPDPQAIFTRPDGRQLTAADEVVTYVARNLEPYRGIHIFLRALEELQRRRPQLQAVIVGNTGVSYGSPPVDGRTWKDTLLETVRLDPDRTCFTGHLPYDEYLKVLQISSAHVYLTFPFVLSWSMTEAMAAGCLIVGSSTPPVQEVMRDGENGLMVDFFNPTEIADRVCYALDNQAALQPLRQAARQTILDGYDQQRHCLPAYRQLLKDLAARRTPASGAEVRS